jgi:tetratricopeptide (TPR) repeat protein
MIFRRNDDDFGSFSLWGAITAPFVNFFRTIGDLIGADDNFERSTFSKFMGLLGLPFRILVAFIGFMAQTWASSRSGYAFVRGLPVLIVCFVFFSALLIEDLFNTEGNKIMVNRGYLQRQVTMFSDNPKDSAMFAQKLVEIKSDEPSHKYELALAKARCGEPQATIDILRSISPDDRAGFAEGHIWLAQYYGRTKVKDLTSEECEAMVDRHLKYALESDPENQMAYITLAERSIARLQDLEENSDEWKHEIKEAIKYLTEVTQGNVTMNQIRTIPRLAELRLKLESIESVYPMLSEAIIQMEPLAQRYPDEVQIWASMIQSAVLAEDYQRALDIVRMGVQTAKNPDVKSQIVSFASKIYLKEAAQYKNVVEPKLFRRKVDILCQAINVNPNDREVCGELLSLIAGPQKVNPEWVRDSIIGARLPGLVHCLLGIMEISKGDVLIGEKHWKIAEKQFPKSNIVINSLLFIAVSKRADDFPHLLDMTSLAIEMFPQQSTLYLTRGIHLFNLERYQEAIQDLLVANEKLPELIRSEQYLIKSFEKINDESNAAKHRFRLEERMGAMDARQRKLVEESMRRLDQRN